MPRPKRAKVASSVPAARVASFAQMSQTTAAPKGNSRTRQNAPRSKRGMPVPAVDIEEIVRPTTKRARADDTVPAAGALERLKRRRTSAVDGEQPSRRSGCAVIIHSNRSGPKPASITSSSPREIEAPRRQAKALSPVDRSTRQGTPLDMHDSDHDGLYNLSPEGEKSQLKLQHRAEASRISIGQSIVPASQPRAHPTPMMEASLLALKNFKRRPRQPSILRKGRLSMQSTTQFDLGSDLDGFNPDDESTPLHINKYPMEKETELYIEAGQPSSPRLDLREQPADKESPQSSPPLEPQIDEAIELMKDTIDLTQGHSSVPSSDGPDLPDYVPETAQNTQGSQQKDWSETMAPPKSTSSLDDSDDREEPPRQTAPGGRTRREEQGTSKKEAAPSKGAISQRQPALSTAHLQKLLPQRRTIRGRRAKPAIVEIPSDREVDSERTPTSAENSPPVRTKAQASRRAPPTKPAGKRNARTPLTPSKQASQKQARKSRPSKTYGRISGASDKENEGSVFDVVESSPSSENFGKGKKGPKLTTAQSAELKGVKDKFAEIDDWEMEFESVDASMDGSSWR